MKTKTVGKKRESKKRKGSPHFQKQQQALLCCGRAAADVEVFNSSSLVNLVKIMHPYCLQLHVEEDGDHLRRQQAFFSQEQVWKYERPKEESDEEVNVVSDDEVRLEEKQVLRSVLLNESQRKRKRVSFGPVQVSSFQTALYKRDQNHTGESLRDSTWKTVAGSELEPPCLSLKVNQKNTEVFPPKAQKKAKALSLHQYRQWQRTRPPLVEPTGNYSARWPSVSETPQELTPILRLLGPNTQEATLQTRVPTVEPPSPSRRRPCSRRKQLGLLPAAAVDPNVILKAKSSLLKQRTLVSSDPPNPVVLPLPLRPRSLSSECSLDWGRQSPEESGTSHSSSGQNQDSSRGPSALNPNTPKPPLASSPTNAAQAEDQDPDRKGTVPGSDSTLQRTSPGKPH